MKVYFAGSIRGGRQDAELYARLIAFIREELGAQVLTEHVGDSRLTDDTVVTEAGKKELDGDPHIDHGMTDKEIHDRDLKWLREADLLVAECTTASLGVGYEVGVATALDIKILCLFRNQPNKRPSAMISGATDVLQFERYTTEEEAKDIIRRVVEAM
eukprot:TRINITY_DN17218_c0_g1_i1.p1 TRINITY_DN17218_c0_g1~~TRINITY_DN17218_c0_g1_i1.p1  ORF type:complete len:158 (-),score=18.68 TRINITY_DN17218_c0_g1_i1:279-752(-)